MPDPGPYPLPADRLEQRLPDKKPALGEGEAVLEAERCLFCYDAPCIAACPTAIDIPIFIKKIATGNLAGSARTILEANLLGASCARVCPVEVLCEGACVYTGWNRKPIQIGRLQRYATDHGASSGLLPRSSITGHSVGLVGAGPASLACAGALALLGHRTVLYEKLSLPGGLNTTGVAPYKMQAEAALAEVDFIRELGVEIRTGVEVGKDISAQDLLDRHDVVFLGPGLGDDSRLGVPGEDGPRVMGAVEWIRRLKTGLDVSVKGIRRAAVIGGGNTAVDAARELAQLGVPEVRLLYRRTETEMRAYDHEWEAAKREGVVLHPETVVTRIDHEDGGALVLQLARTEGGRSTDTPLDHLPVDLLAVAIGQPGFRGLVSLFPGVEMKRGCIVADEETGVTGNPRVFAGGDARNGGKEVVNAVDEGQRAARGIHAFLTGEDRAQNSHGR